MKVSIIIPTKNEEKNIAALLSHFNYAGSEIAYEAIVVDDSDNNFTMVAAALAGAKIIKGRSVGLSQAVIDGIAEAQGDAIVVMDADFQHPPELVPKIAEELKNHDFVVASRYVDGGGCEVWDLDRKVISRVANLAARPLVPKVKDSVSGFFGFRRDGAPELSSLSGRGFKIMLELLVKGNWKNVVEIPYTFGVRKEGSSKLGRKQVSEYLIQLASLYLYKYPILKFMLVGASGVLVNLAVLAALTELAGIYYLASFAVAFMCAATNNYWWNKLWTFKGRATAKLGYLRYLTLTSVTLLLDEALLYAFTEWCGIWYVASATIAIMIVFVIRYLASKRFIWSETKVTKLE